MDPDTLFRLALGIILCLGIASAIAERRQHENH